MRTTRLRSATPGTRPACGPAASAQRPSWLGRPRLQQAPLGDGTGCRRSPPSGWRWRPVTETIEMVPFELRVEAWLLVLGLAVRSEERRFGKDGVRKLISWWSAAHLKKK